MNKTTISINHTMATKNNSKELSNLAESIKAMSNDPKWVEALNKMHEKENAKQRKVHTRQGYSNH